MSIFWSPHDGKVFSLQGSYSWSALKSDILYLVPALADAGDLELSRQCAHGDRPVQLQSGALGGGGAEAHRRRIVVHLLRQPAHQLLSADGEAVGAGRRSTRRFAEWWYYGYGEAFYPYEGFGAHLVTIGLEVHAMRRALCAVLMCWPRLPYKRRGSIWRIRRADGRLFETLSCVQCHSVNGKGGTVGPDLGRIVDRDFTPATLAATMWNHAPAMWAAMQTREVSTLGDLNEQAAADLFAYFYSARFFEKPGDAGARQTRVYRPRHARNATACTEAKLPRLKPVEQWESLGDPMALIEAMWNHAATMRRRRGSSKLRWPELTAQDLTDMLVYLRNLPCRRPSRRCFRSAPAPKARRCLSRRMRGLPSSVAELSARNAGKNSDRYRRRDVES